MEYRINSKEEALATVDADGTRLRNLPYIFRDDPEVVKAALEHGGFFEAASFRLQNDPDIIAFCMQHATSPQRLSYADILFMTIYHPELSAIRKNRFRAHREFNVEAKLACGNRYSSVFPEYDSMDQKQLQKELQIVRQEILKEYRTLYNSYTTEGENQRNPDKRQLERTFWEQGLPFSSPYGLRLVKRPLSYLLDEIDIREGFYREEKEVYCSLFRRGSFGERFIDSFLTYMGISFTRECIFSWSTGNTSANNNGTKRYDFYLPNQNAIIEVHGAQHYQKGFEALGGRTLEEEQKNDKYKMELAIKNGIKHYIVLDARVSKESFLIRSITNNSELQAVLSTESTDWLAVAKGMIIKRDVFPTPLYDLRMGRLAGYSSIISQMLDDADSVDPPVLMQFEAIKSRKDRKPQTQGKCGNVGKITDSIIRKLKTELKNGINEQASSFWASGDYQKALIENVKLLYLDVCGAVDDTITVPADKRHRDVRFEDFVRHTFPYATSRVRCTPAFVSKLRSCKKRGEIDDERFENIVKETVRGMRPEWMHRRIFDDNEIAQIIIYETYKNAIGLSEIYESAHKRLLESGFIEQ